MRISNAFIVTADTIEVVEHDSLTDSHLYKPGGYTPPLFRRPRLARFRPLVHRIHVCRSLWRWQGSRPKAKR